MSAQNVISPGSGRFVAVFGASGHTGRFVVAELLRRGFKPIPIGRDASRLAASGFQHRGMESRTATMEDPASLDRALAGAAAVINCAGPFLDTAEPLVAAAVRARVHYLDVTAEQSSALAIFERFAAPARDAKIVVAPAMGFYGGLGDLLATAAMGDWASADEIRIGIALDSWRPTLGTRLTGQRNTAPRLVITGGKLAPLGNPPPASSWTFPEPFGVQQVMEVPLTEIVVIGRHLRVSHLHTFLNLAPLRDLRDPTTPPPAAADETGRSAQIFLVDVTVRNGTDIRRAIARGRDIYAFTAPLVVEAAQRILDGAAEGVGVLAPGELFDAPSFLRALTPQYLTLESEVSTSAKACWHQTSAQARTLDS
jgi:NAD(P)-dependent dehydrogenase (short-subunit alcohol dehydrogenase family)